MSKTISVKDCEDLYELGFIVIHYKNELFFEKEEE